MKNNIPWLITRKHILIFAIVDFLIIFFSFSIFSSKSLNSIFFSLPFIFVSINWIVSSYVFGRYTYKLEKYIYIIIKNILKSFIVCFLSIASLAVLSLLIGNMIDILYNVKVFSFFSLIAILSSLFQLLINFFFVTLLVKKQNWLLIGSEESYANLTEQLNWSRVDCKIDFQNNFEINSESLKKHSGIIIENFDILEKIDLDEILKLKIKGVEIFSILEWSEVVLQRYPPNLFNNMYFLSNRFSLPKGTFQLRLKRLCEFLISIILLLITSPFILIAALLIKLEDRGPVFYSHIRSGFGGAPFRIYKLRTMRTNAESSGAQWAKKNDSRITFIGSILRSTRIDELPQLWSVLTGQMSLIGPRPERPEIEKSLISKIPHYQLRYLMRPGLSGWAQVNYPYGASVKDSSNKLSYDLYYLLHFSTLLDLLIMLKTIRVVFNARGSIPSHHSGRL